MAVAKKTQRISKKEEEALIKMFSRDVSNKGQASFFVNALLAAATPLFMYIRIQQVDVPSAWHVMAVFTAVTAYVLQFTYGKAKFGLKQKMAQGIHEGITREVMGSFRTGFFSEKCGVFTSYSVSAGFYMPKYGQKCV